MKLLILTSLAVMALELVNAGPPDRHCDPSKLPIKNDFIDLVTNTDDMNRFQSLQHRKYLVRKCVCQNWRSDYREITYNVHRVKTNNSCFFLYVNENCEGPYAVVNTESSNDFLILINNYCNLSGNVRSLQVCY